ncbi:MAG: DUF3995 domain-containing protein [Candidatus Dormiibacter spiritus]|nr:MAG: DUF3995 domain-containing protein [Candidatus Dormibacteraeota bacterium]
MVWLGWATCAWAWIFSLQSFYFAAGGSVGSSAFPPALVQPVMERQPAAVALMWGTGALKVLVGLLALALIAGPRGWLARRLLLGVAWLGSVLIAGYEGLASLIQHALMVAGVVPIPAGLGGESARWHLWLFDPWWLLGGVLLGLTAWQARYRHES